MSLKFTMEDSKESDAETIEYLKFQLYSHDMYKHRDKLKNHVKECVSEQTN